MSSWHWLSAKINCLLKDYTFSTLLCSLGKVWIYAHISLLCYLCIMLPSSVLVQPQRKEKHHEMQFLACWSCRECQFLKLLANHYSSALEALSLFATFDLKQTCSYSKLCHCCFCYSAYFCSLLPSTLLHLHWLN